MHSTLAQRLLAVFVFISSLLALFTISPSIGTSRTTRVQCHKPVRQPEWRMLSDEERRGFIDAVVCMTETPSDRETEGSLYDDFSLVHMIAGSPNHAAASFFPWHRIYLHLFEEQLKTRCGYQGSLPYWDWTLDYLDIHKAPVWDHSTGFGGNGSGVTETALPNATCVSDGPLSSMKPLYFNAKRMPHCLSRAFVHLDAEGVYARALGPEAWLKILNQTDYDSFRRDMDDTVHNTIHGAVGGDFLDINSSNDPIFYLHHAQLDRLWWMWQKQRTHRVFEYHGPRSETSNMSASLDDELSFMYLHRGVSVADAMRTESGMLCYQY